MINNCLNFEIKGSIFKLYRLMVIKFLWFIFLNIKKIIIYMYYVSNDYNIICVLFFFNVYVMW